MAMHYAQLLSSEPDLPMVSQAALLRTCITQGYLKDPWFSDAQHMLPFVNNQGLYWQRWLAQYCCHP